MAGSNAGSPRDNGISVTSGSGPDLLLMDDADRWRHVLPPLLARDELPAFACRPEVARYPVEVFRRRFRFELAP